MPRRSDRVAKEAEGRGDADAPTATSSHKRQPFGFTPGGFFVHRNLMLRNGNLGSVRSFSVARERASSPQAPGLQRAAGRSSTNSGAGAARGGTCRGCRTRQVIPLVRIKSQDCVYPRCRWWGLQRRKRRGPSQVAAGAIQHAGRCAAAAGLAEADAPTQRRPLKARDALEAVRRPNGALLSRTEAPIF